MTFKVIIRTDVIYKDNSSPLCLLFFHDGRKKSVGLGVSVVRSCWDAQAQKVTDDCPDRDDIQFQITAKIKEYEKKIKKLEALEIPVTFETLFETIGKRMDCTVGDYFRQIIDRLEKVEKYGSASKHKVTLALMSQFRSVNMRFDELDLTYLREFEIFLSQKGNVNNSCNYAAFQYCLLYLIEILHQTTTLSLHIYLCCALYLIEILHQTTTFGHLRLRLFALYLIEILHQTTTRFRRFCYRFRLYLIEILHQTTTDYLALEVHIRLYLIEILHQTTTLVLLLPLLLRCILSKFYIKPQPVVFLCVLSIVVSYRNSTSNHNFMSGIARCIGVVSYRNSTSNHNNPFVEGSVIQVVSYRNSTSNHNNKSNEILDIVLYLIEIPHQTTTRAGTTSSATRLYLIEIPHQTTTESHPWFRSCCCILSKFHIKPQLLMYFNLAFHRCILSKFHIKPQLSRQWLLVPCVVSYRNSTSNHNVGASGPSGGSVVSYRNSTSNHNQYFPMAVVPSVVSYRNSTSNHNHKRARYVVK